MSWQPEDQAQRNAAIDTAKSFVVQAPAGSGKTGILVYRMLALLAKVERPEQVLAITFTRKAAKEMRERVFEVLQDAAKGKDTDDAFEQKGIELAHAVLKNSKANDWRLLELRSRLNVSTIDSLCSKLVAYMPWLSRLGEPPKVTENAREHFEFAVDQLLKELLDENSSIHESLKHWLHSQDFKYGRVRKQLVTMLAKRDQWQSYLFSDGVSRENIEQAWRLVSESMLDNLHHSVPKDLRDEMLHLAKFSAEYKTSKEKEKPNIADWRLNFPSACFATIDRFPKNDFADLELWKGIQFLLITPSTNKIRSRVSKTEGFPAGTDEHKRKKDLLNRLDSHPEFIENLLSVSNIPSPEFNDAQWEQVKSLTDILRHLLSLLQLRFHNARECDYSEVSQRANRALSDMGKPTDLALRMDYQLQHILVDEFQDTSYSQFRLLENLTKGWQQDDGRTLFLVGDPMQSIYRFRQAEVGLFLQAFKQKGVINNIELHPLTLSENFRSSKTLVEWFNRIFTKGFPRNDDETLGSIKYANATSHKSAANEPTVHGFFSDEEEAEHVVDLVDQALKRGDEKIAILVRGRSQLTKILPALRENDIPFEGFKIQRLDETQSIYDALSLCKALIRLDDKVAWLSLLRGPLVGMVLTDITLLTAGESLLIWERLNSREFIKRLPDSTQKSVKRFTKVMGDALKQKQQVPLNQLAKWVWNELGGNATLQQISDEDFAPIWAAIAELENGGDIDKLSYLDESIKELFALSRSSDTKQSVIVTTMHQAKGLQYDTVILPALNKKGRPDEADVLSWTEVVEGKEKCLLLAPKVLHEEKNNSQYEYLKTLEKARSKNEMIRLLYVATTRAEKNLHLSFQVQDSKKGGVIPKSLNQGLMSHVWDYLIDDTEFVGEAPEQGEQEKSLLDQTLYRLPENYEAYKNAPIDWQGKELSPPKQDKELEFEWATSIAKTVGIVLHNFLQYRSHELYQIKIDDHLKAYWRTELFALNLEPEKIASAIKRLSFAVNSMQNDDRAKWIFSDHDDAKNEYSLTSFEDGEMHQHIIDRTFVENGYRWVVDYKSTSHFEENTAEFVDDQVIRHQEQLERYASVFGKIDARPIKLGLYFPLLSQWREWEYENNHD